MAPLRHIVLSLFAILPHSAHGAVPVQSPNSPRLELIPAHAGHGINTTLTIPRDTDAVFAPLAKRQHNCPSHCRYCCEDLVCVSSLADVCCGGYYCLAGDTCSNTGKCCPEGTKACDDGCIPEGGECCSSGGYCEPGLYCYLVDGYQPTCCPSGGCYGDSDYDYTTTAATTTYEYTTTDYTISTSTYADWDYYTRTITWTYWVTFYTYYVPSSTDLRTSSTTTTTTIVSVYATDSADASSSLDEISATITDNVPSTATDPPRPTTSGTETETETARLGGGDGGFTSGGIVFGTPVYASWYGLVLIFWAALMPAVLALCL